METRGDLFFANLNGYSIYQYQNDYLGVYYLCIPDDYTDTYDMFISFPRKDLKGLPKHEIIEEITDINNMINGVNKASIYAIPDIESKELEEATKENDDKLYTKILNKVQSMTYDINKKFSSNDVHAQSINQVIKIIKLNESDTKFVQWLEMKMPYFIHGISLDELRKFYYDKVTGEKESDNSLDTNLIFDKPTKKVTGDLEHNNYTNTIENTKVRKLVPQKDNQNAGFNSMSFIILTLIISLVLGICIGYLIIK